MRLLKLIKNFFTIEIHTDGSSKAGVGSWAYVVSRRGKITTEKSARVRGASSNVMEFQAAIEALRALPAKSKVTLFSDSRILIDAMKFKNGPKIYLEQINELLALNQKHKISWQWIKAHNGNALNERCDELCTLARIKKCVNHFPRET